MDSLTFSPKKGIRGLADRLGFDLGDPIRNYRERVQFAVEKLKNYDLVHLHFPEPDNCSHNNNPREKKDTLESIDDALKPVLDWDDGLVIVTPDHTTPCRPFDDHTADPVPIIMKGSEVRVDDVDRYDEVSTAGGAIGTLLEPMTCLGGCLTTADV